MLVLILELSPSAASLIGRQSAVSERTRPPPIHDRNQPYYPILPPAVKGEKIAGRTSSRAK
jgi:hypothetical protein